MRKLLITSLVFMHCQITFANDTAKILFLCESSNKPTYEYSINSDGSVSEISDGHFSDRLSVKEQYLPNGDVRVLLSPFHHYCSVGISYLNHTNNIHKSIPGFLFSRTANLATSCEGGPVENRICRIIVR